jgi:hypothetical protein
MAGDGQIILPMNINENIYKEIYKEMYEEMYEKKGEDKREPVTYRMRNPKQNA